MSFDSIKGDQIRTAQAILLEEALAQVKQVDREDPTPTTLTSHSQPMPTQATRVKEIQEIQGTESNTTMGKANKPIPNLSPEEDGSIQLNLTQAGKRELKLRQILL